MFNLIFQGGKGQLQKNYTLLMFTSQKRNIFPGILRDTTMDDKLIYITNDDKQNYTLPT